MAIGWNVDLLTLGRKAQNTGGGQALRGCHFAIWGTDKDKQVMEAGANAQCFGVVVGALDEEFTAGDTASVQVLGVAKVKAGGAINAGDAVAADSAACAVATTTDKDLIQGVAMEDIASGAVGAILLAKSFMSHT